MALSKTSTGTPVRRSNTIGNRSRHSAHRTVAATSSTLMGSNYFAPAATFNASRIDEAKFKAFSAPSVFTVASITVRLRIS